ncbi:FHA domain-containing protein [Nocardia thailandica]|uniref:FHA domain-containing protein n=1 Tax=Nocardia thailandica TaxID=257275 RepID=A0ABW6PPC4_9NOCA
MPVCPDGHVSTALDYCDVCGAALATAPAPDPVPLRLCPNCATPSGGRFCESCGHDSALPAPRGPAVGAAQATVITEAPVPAGAPVWFATVGADREYYARVLAREGPDAEQVGFPGFFPRRRIQLAGPEILIGKRSVSQGVEPGIDLSLAPADAGVSRVHAMIRLDGTELTVTDLGSTNGTCLNGDDRPLRPQAPAVLRDGDRIHVGAWTTIVVSLGPAES